MREGREEGEREKSMLWKQYEQARAEGTSLAPLSFYAREPSCHVLLLLFLRYSSLWLCLCVEPVCCLEGRRYCC